MTAQHTADRSPASSRKHAIAARPRPTRRRRWLFASLAIIVATVVAVALGELMIAAVLRWPSALTRLPTKARENLANLYFNRIRNNVQFDPTMARWDRELFYTLRPGHFTISAPEYAVDVEVNQLGVRDDDASLNDPAIVVIGDSFAMGYGVRQPESFPEQLGRLTGLKTLNLGVSSYGTVRERRLLDRARVRPRYLVVQYCDNDALENAVFAVAGNRYPGRSAAHYQTLADANASNIRYYPGKYLDALMGTSAFASVFGYSFARPSWVESPPEVVPGNDAFLFLNALLYAGEMNLEGVQLVVFEAKGMHRPADMRFLNMLAEELRRGNYPSYLRQMVLVDVSSALGPGSVYDLDDHWTAAGHAGVAARLAQVIR